ncbi:RNA polymerase subunit sigma-24 [Bryobacterales bacterium F-183]|nr:RNA polymerase subunit sigma-24 [Bryobacterales bacterium F-183]
MERDQEIEITRRLLAGDPEAFDRFVEHFRGKIFNYSWLMCGQRDDAEEVAQETLMNVFENLGQLREPDRVRPWVFRIAKNACLTKRRRSVFAPSKEISLDQLMPVRHQEGDGFRLEIADWTHLPEDEAMRAELKREVQRAIRNLPELYRPVILLRDVEGLSTQETAQILDLNEDAVKTRLHRARLAVRKELDARLRREQTVEA